MLAHPGVTALVQIVHRDIKSSNILLARDGTAKLADVGLAKILRNDFLSTLQGQLGTFAWAAPEVLRFSSLCRAEKLSCCCIASCCTLPCGAALWSAGEAPSQKVLKIICDC